jgi:hypothetical protein
MNNNFNEEDKKKVIQFLNLIAEKARLDLNTQEVIQYYGLLSYMQKELIPKIDSNILEIVAVHESEDSKEE